jgi:hypothetical protein
MFKRPKEFNEIQNQDLNLKFSSFCILWTSWLSQQFLRIYWILIVAYSQKIISSSWLVPQVFKFTRIIEVRRYLFQGSKQSYSSQVPRLEKISEWLTISYLWNSITSWILGVRLCMSTRKKSNVHRPSWRTPYPSWSTGGFITVGLISLSGQLFWILWNEVMFTTC